MADFCTKAFGWQTKMLGPEMGEYVLVTTTESEENEGMTGRPKKPGARSGIEVNDAEAADCPADPAAPPGLARSAVGADCRGKECPAISGAEVRP